MPGVPGAVGAGLTLANLLVGWFLKPNGYATWTREKKLEALAEGLKVALDEKNMEAADVIFAEMRKLAQETGP